MNSANQHLIIGATGKTGSRVMQQLKKLGHNPIGASRKRLKEFDWVQFDWNDPTTWAAALHGADSVYLTYYPDLAVPKAPEDISRFCALAKIKGVQHITLLSGRGEPAAQVSENIVKQSGINWTIVRAAWFNQNFSEGLFKQFITSGKIALPVGATSEPFVDVDDIAEVVTASLTDPKHAGELYEVTGPELLSFEQLSQRFSQVLKQKVSFEHISLTDFRSEMTAGQVDVGAIEALTYLFTEVLDGRSEFLTDGIQRALGRSPKSFDQYILDNAHLFVEAA